jgi:methionyl-tRNA formyltransferase
MDLGVPVFEPTSLRDFAQACRRDMYDLFVLASYGKILPQALLDVPKFGAFNVHPSLLPKYRGATPIQTALRDGETETGVTIMLMDAGMDTGDIVLQERTPIDEDERYGELHDRLAVFGAQALSHAIDLARSGYIPHRPQSGKPTLTHPLSKADLVLDWRWPAQRIVNMVRAYAPGPAARATLGGAAVKLLRARQGTASIAPLPPGEIVGVLDDAVSVRCADGTVDILELIAPNRGRQTGAAFARALRQAQDDTQEAQGDKRQAQGDTQTAQGERAR